MKIIEYEKTQYQEEVVRVVLEDLNRDHYTVVARYEPNTRVPFLVKIKMESLGHEGKHDNLIKYIVTGSYEWRNGKGHGEFKTQHAEAIKIIMRCMEM